MSESSSNLNKQLVSMNPDSIIELFEIDFSDIPLDSSVFGDDMGPEPVYRFTSMINGSNPIVWQGKSYQPMPIKMEGFESSGAGKLPRPSLSLANPEGIFSKIVYSNQDFLNCKVTRKRTFLRFLDEENFQNRNLNEDFKNPFGSSDMKAHLPDDVYFINRKTLEDREQIRFELASPLELENAWIPARKVMSNYCCWTYRCDIGCGYKGLPIETIDGASLTKGFSVEEKKKNGEIDTGRVDPQNYPAMMADVPHWSSRDAQDLPLSYLVGDVVQIVQKNTQNPYSRTPQVFVCCQNHNNKDQVRHPFLHKDFWLKDECSKTANSCRKRFSDDFRSLNEYNTIPGTDSNDRGLRFGGFPGTEDYPIE